MSKFIAERWVSWLMELGVLLLIAWFAISENHKTQEQTRDMLRKYDAAVASFVSERVAATDEKAAEEMEALKRKLRSLDKEAARELIRELAKTGL